MHTDLSAHLHTPECNDLINELKRCHTENKFAKFIGVCNTADQLVVNCLKKERIERRRLNYEKAQITQRRSQERMRQFKIEEEERR